MVLLNQMIRTRRFTEFIIEVINLYNEEEDEKTVWEFWLHKDHEHTYSECRDLILNKTAPPATTEQVIDIINQSREIASFVPPET